MIISKILFFTILINTSHQIADQDDRIIGGTLALPGEVPYQVSIQHTLFKNHICGGSIISPSHVLTAAHCLTYRSGKVFAPDDILIVAGQLDWVVDQNTISRNASKIIVHPDFDHNLMKNDLGIIFVEPALDIDNKTVAAVELRTENTELVYQSNCQISGWGVDTFKSNNLSIHLQTTTVQTISQSECQDRYDKINVTIWKEMLCGTFKHTHNPNDACQGDSGGPLVCHGLLTGVISTGHGCGNKSFPGIYTNVAYYTQWIQQQIYYGQNEEIEQLPDTSSSLTLVHQVIRVESNNNPLNPSPPPFPLVIYNQLFFFDKNNTHITIINPNGVFDSNKEEQKRKKSVGRKKGRTIVKWFIIYLVVALAFILLC